MIPRLKAGLWVAAQVRLCSALAVPLYVLRRGDEDAGMVLIKLIGGAGEAVVLSPFRAADESLAWMRATGPEPVSEEKAEAYLARQVDIDPDLWIVEIDDPAGMWQPDGPVI
jgi:GMP synthase (glutamine-hydrolysing)